MLRGLRLLPGSGHTTGEQNLPGPHSLVWSCRCRQQIGKGGALDPWTAVHWWKSRASSGAPYSMLVCWELLVHAMRGIRVPVPGRCGSAPPGTGFWGWSFSRCSAPLPTQPVLSVSQGSPLWQHLLLSGSTGIEISWIPVACWVVCLEAGSPLQCGGYQLGLGRAGSPSCCTTMLEI